MFRYSGQLTGIVLISLLCYLLFWSAVGGGYASEWRSNTKPVRKQLVPDRGGQRVETIKTSATESQFNRRWRQVLARYVRASLAVRRQGTWQVKGSRSLIK